MPLSLVPESTTDCEQGLRVGRERGTQGNFGGDVYVHYLDYSDGFTCQK